MKVIVANIKNHIESDISINIVSTYFILELQILILQDFKTIRGQSMSIKLKLIIVLITVFIFFLTTGILVSVDILDRAVGTGENPHIQEVLKLSVDLIKKSREGEPLPADSIDQYESCIVAAIANSKQRLMFRDDLLKKLIILLVLNAIPYVILAYFAIVFVVSRTVRPIIQLTNDIQKYPNLEPEMLTVNSYADKEVHKLTEQFKVMLESITEYQKKLEARSKLDGWIEVSRAIIHEVGNAMAPAKNQIRQLIKEFPENNNLSVVKRSINKMDDIIRHMRQFYKSETLIRTTFNLIEELDFICEGYGVNFDNRTKSDTLLISGGKTECTQLFINLIKNALDAASEAEKPWVQVAINFILNDLYIEVNDNGKGIEPDQVNRIFTPGISSKPEGFGIGLALVAKYITLHEWILDVDSHPNKGTQFSITIPKRDIHETISVAS